jgi:MtN3 and saliva related transmembrane protein
MFLIFSVGTFTWLVYGVLVHSAPMWIANGVTFALSMSILGLKLRFDWRARNPHQPQVAPDTQKD